MGSLFVFPYRKRGQGSWSETEANLKDLFVFLTGSDRIPPMGFPRKGKIAIDHQDNSQELRFPSGSTCQPKSPDRHWRAVYQIDKCSLSSRDNLAR